MARGESGRIVLEIDPSRKDDLYSALNKDGFTLKDWFLQQADAYIRNRDQMELFRGDAVAEQPPAYGKKSPVACPAKNLDAALERETPNELYRI